jgi:hypothetical protein
MCIVDVFLDITNLFSTIENTKKVIEDLIPLARVTM